jgi:tetratricopeptide (TPR) repeat protein
VHRHSRFGWLTASLLFGTLAATGAPLNGEPTAQPAGTRRIVILGVDAADWIAIDPLIRAGKLPTFGRLRARGRTGVMLSTPPLVSPMVWTTIATGVEPEDHGILDFTADLPDGRQVPVGSSQRLAPALWNLFSQAGRRVAVVGWWATWPAEQVNGVIVSDALAPQLTRPIAHGDKRAQPDPWLVSPASIAPRIRPYVVQTESLGVTDLSAYLPITPEEHASIGRQQASADPKRFFSDPVSHLAAVIAATRTYATIAQELIRSERPELVAIYLESVDTLSHVFVKSGRQGAQGAMDQAYVDADTLLRRLVEASPPDALVIVCSDHGFYPASAGIAESPTDLTGPATAWHRPYGIVGAATAGMLVSDRLDSSFGTPGSIGIVTPLDLAPTVLHAAGLPVPTDMPGRIVREMLPAEARDREPRRVPAAPYTRVPLPSAARADSEEALARLQALGYIGAARTSLARQNLGESFLRRGKLEVQPKNLSANLWLAQALARQGRSAAAIAIYERAVALPGGAREALVAAVDLSVASGDLTAAERLIAAGESSKDAQSAVLVARGAVAEARRDPRRAETSYRAALDAEPAQFDAAARLFELLAAGGRAAEALPAVERAARAVPDSPRHLALLGEARLSVRDAAGAESALRRALEMVPDGDAVRIMLARALVARSKPDDAIAVASAAGTSADRDVVLGAASAAKRDFEGAIRYLTSALGSGRATPEVLNGIGYASMQLGRQQDAAAMFEKSLQVKANQPEIRRLLAEIRKTPGAEDHA